MIKSNAPSSSVRKATPLGSNGSNVRWLLIWFAAWKGILLAIAAFSPGPGYDTSTRLLFQHNRSPETSIFGSIIEHVVLRLTRWDGVYYASIAERGCVNEQDWAFCSLWARHPVPLAKVSTFLSIPPVVTHALASSCIAHLSHFLAVVVLYRLTSRILPFANSKSRKDIAFIAACLHIISPGGLFLSAPNLESTFGFWSFVAALFYTNAIAAHLIESKSGRWPLVVGLLFGITTTVRSNGILSGTIPLWDLFVVLRQQQHALVSLQTVSLALPIIIAGSLIGIGFVAPQIPPYIEYCSSNGTPRPWCTHFPPSIYRWVQSHYWNVGFLRYWTLGNIPLFLLAAPMLCIFGWTAWICLFHADKIVEMFEPKLNEHSGTSNSSVATRPNDYQIQTKIWLTCAPRLALPQLLLAILCLTSFHVQIINRLAVAYPMWYIILAIALYGTADTRSDEDVVAGPRDSGIHRPLWPAGAEKLEKFGFTQGRVKWIVRGMAVYAIIQGGLFAAFLPPA